MLVVVESLNKAGEQRSGLPRPGAGLHSEQQSIDREISWRIFRQRVHVDVGL